MDKEKILPPIKLKYYERPTGKPKNKIKCFLCRKVGIRVGSAIDAYSKNPKLICEECAIKNFQINNKFKTYKAAAAYRRRMFDVGYLFNEMVTDQYLNGNNLVSLDDLDFGLKERLLGLGAEIYNKFLSKKQKIKLEKIEKQEEIEKELKKLLKHVSFE